MAAAAAALLFTALSSNTLRFSTSLFNYAKFQLSSYASPSRTKSGGVPGTSELEHLKKQPKKPKLLLHQRKSQKNSASKPVCGSAKEEGKEQGKEEKSKGDQAKKHLAKYRGAYLATSITLSLVSFSLCYELVGAGIDVQALLQKLGISTNETGEKVGTFALAYAAHKAASPIRFPPTVGLTPIVASWIGKKAQKEK